MKRILLIEGNTNIRKFIKRELHKSGHVVMETADGHEALVMLKQDKPDILIVDIHTKKKKILEAFRVEATSTTQWPVIILTSKTPHEMDVSNWNPSVILERSCKTPEILSAIEKVSKSSAAKKKEAPDINNLSSDQPS